MAVFPILDSGAITQYPASATYRQSVRVIPFLDGSDQRFLTQGRQYRRWRIQVDLLSDAELAALESFFISQKGMYSAFTFKDPLNNADVPNCRIRSPELVSDYEALNAGSISLWVIETNG